MSKADSGGKTVFFRIWWQKSGKYRASNSNGLQAEAYKTLFYLVHPRGFEPPTYGTGIRMNLYS